MARTKSIGVCAVNAVAKRTANAKVVKAGIQQCFRMTRDTEKRRLSLGRNAVAIYRLKGRVFTPAIPDRISRLYTLKNLQAIQLSSLLDSSVMLYEERVNDL